MPKKPVVHTYSINKIELMRAGESVQNITSDQQLKHSKEYLKGFDDIKLRVVHGEREKFRDYATSHRWKSLNECMRMLMNYAMVQNLTKDQVADVINNSNNSNKQLK